MANLEGLHIRQVALNDLSHLKPLVEVSFGRAADEAYFDWKYCRNPNGPVVGHEAIAADGQVAAFYGVIPERYLVNGDPIRVYQSMDTMTHPDFRRRGVFTHLAERTYQYLHDTEGACLLIGIPGPTSLAGYIKKLGWQQPLSFQLWFAPRYALPRPRDQGISVCAIAASAELGDYFERYAPSTGPVVVDLNPAFVEWRVIQHPVRAQNILAARCADHVIALCAYTVAEPGRVLITMLTALDQEALVASLPALMDGIVSDTRASWVYTWRPCTVAYRSALRRMRFVANPLRRGPFSYRVPLLTRSDRERINGVRWSDASSFDLQPFMQD